MTHIERSIELLKWLRDSGVTSYRIRQETGMSETAARKFLIGESDLENMRLGNAALLEKLARKLKEDIKMENKINELIAAVENGEIGLVQDWQFGEVEYTDGATDIYIEQDVEGHEDIALLFAEFDHIKEVRTDVYRERKPQSALDELLTGTNGLDDQFNYDKVVGYRFESGPIMWL